ncbi:MAG TPA: hypothetical protein VHD56_12485 [Tepidisphaeraceae bacterium]|nr:hypothetical protein [Tepidisphaeraceae bacterium]
MRITLLGCLLIVSMVLQGCALSPGKSPAELKAANTTPGYVERPFNDMHPDLM